MSTDMFTSKAQSLFLTLVLYITLAFILTPNAVAEHAPALVHRRDHFQLNRMIKQQVQDIGIFPTATNSEFMMPIYPSTVSDLNVIHIIFLTRPHQTNGAAFTTPTFNDKSNPDKSWPADPFQPSNPSPTQVREDRPRLIAPAYKWAALPRLIANDPYLAFWNKTIFGNASDYYNLPPVAYFKDGPSGILDNSREIKMRLKTFSYAYRMTKDTKWANRAWLELQVSDPLRQEYTYLVA